MEIKQTFASRLSKCIAEAGLRKIQIANIIGITSGGLSQILSGATFPSADKIAHLARVLEVKTDYLLGLTDELPCQLSNSPEGILPYWISLNKGDAGIHGSFRYVYGIYPQENRKFLYLDEQPGGTFIKSIINSMSQSNFLSLTSLLNWELKFNYNPFGRGNTDIVFTFTNKIDVETMSDGSRFNGLGIEKNRIIYLYSISPAYHDFLDQYLAKTTAEKIAFLRKLRMGETDAE